MKRSRLLTAALAGVMALAPSAGFTVECDGTYAGTGRQSTRDVGAAVAGAREAARRRRANKQAAQAANDKIEDIGNQLIDWMDGIDKVEGEPGKNIIFIGNNGNIFQVHPDGHGDRIPPHFHLQHTEGSGKPKDVYPGPDGRPVHQIPFAPEPSVTPPVTPKGPVKIGQVIIKNAAGQVIKILDVWSYVTDPVGSAAETVVEKIILTPTGAVLTAEALAAIAVSAGAIVVAVGIVTITEDMNDLIEEWERNLAPQPLTPIRLTAGNLAEACRIVIDEHDNGTEYDNFSIGLAEDFIYEALEDGILQVDDDDDDSGGSGGSGGSVIDACRSYVSDYRDFQQEYDDYRSGR